MMRTQRVVLMRGEAGQEAVILNTNEIKILDWKPCTEDLINAHERNGHARDAKDTQGHANPSLNA